MCDKCVIEIHDPTVNSEKKFQKSLEVLTKAFGRTVRFEEKRAPKELSPYLAIRQFEDQIIDSVESNLYALWEQMCRRWLRMSKADGDLFVLNAKTFLNPKSGKPLTVGEWKSIKRDLTKVLSWIYTNEEERLVKEAMALGKILDYMSVENAIRTPLKDIKLDRDRAVRELTDSTYQRILRFAEEHTAENIVDLTQRQYKSIHDTIMQAHLEKWSTKKLESELFDRFGEMNRDWQRIAATEIATNTNNGKLLSTLERSSERYIFMKGISAADACDWCRSKVADQVVVLVNEPPTAGDEIEVNGTRYTAIWPGKNNVGRKKRDWWVSAGSQHPWCIVPGQSVQAFLPNAVFKGFYEGRVVEIGTETGRRVTVTENHPILTPDGYIAAKFLSVGGYVVSSSGANDAVRSVNPNYYQAPALIEDLYRSAEHASTMSPMVVPVSTKDFHSDGRCMDSKVSVVNAYGLLGSDFESFFLKELKEKGFSFGRDTFPFDSDGSVDEFGFRDSGTSPSSIGSLDELLSLFNWGSLHPALVGFGGVSGSDTSFDETLSKGASCHTDFSRELLLRFTSDVPLDDIIREGRELDDSTSFVFDRITHVGTSDYSGDVYDIADDIYLSYTVNGVLVKNCRCNWIKHTPGFEKYDKMLKESMDKATDRWYREHPVEAGKKLFNQTQKRIYQRERLNEFLAERNKKVRPAGE